MSKNKSEILAEFIRRKVAKAIAEVAADRLRQNKTEVARILADESRDIASALSYEIAHNAYGRMELEDILRWKIRRSHWE